MPKIAWVALTIGGLVFCFGQAQAGWNGPASSLTLQTSLPIVSIKKNKDDDHKGKNQKAKNKNKNKHDDDDDNQQADTNSGGGGKTTGTGDVPPATLLLPYFECDLSKNNSCSNANGQK